MGGATYDDPQGARTGAFAPFDVVVRINNANQSERAHGRMSTASKTMVRPLTQKGKSAK
jgi:hypothetical protein